MNCNAWRGRACTVADPAERARHQLSVETVVPDLQAYFTPPLSRADCLRCVAVPNGPKTKEIFTAVTPHNPSISGLPHDLPSSVARQQRKIPDPRPPQAAGALKIALLGAHGEHVPRGALKELDQSTLLLLLLSVLCAAHVQAIHRSCGGIDESLWSPMLIENIGPQMDSDCTRLTGAEHTVST